MKITRSQNVNGLLTTGEQIWILAEIGSGKNRILWSWSDLRHIIVGRFRQIWPFGQIWSIVGNGEFVLTNNHVWSKTKPFWIKPFQDWRWVYGSTMFYSVRTGAPCISWTASCWQSWLDHVVVDGIGTLFRSTASACVSDSRTTKAVLCFLCAFWSSRLPEWHNPKLNLKF